MSEFDLVRVLSPQLLTDVRRGCESDHYLHRYPDPRSLPFAYALTYFGQTHMPDGRLNGWMVMKKLQHHKQRGLFGYDGLPTAWQVLDLARVWIHPYHQQPGQYVFSRMVSMLMRRVQHDWISHHPPSKTSSLAMAKFNAILKADAVCGGGEGGVSVMHYEYVDHNWCPDCGEMRGVCRCDEMRGSSQEVLKALYDADGEADTEG